jgi:phenylalanyl-tRNA synthetase beta chain
VLGRPVPSFTPVSRQQDVTRDLALVLRDQVTHAALMAALRDDPQGPVRDATLFDIWKPATPAAGLQAGERSLAVRLVLRDDAASLTEDRIKAAESAAVARAAAACGARLRA